MDCNGISSRSGTCCAVFFNLKTTVFARSSMPAGHEVARSCIFIPHPLTALLFFFGIGAISADVSELLALERYWCLLHVLTRGVLT